MGDRIEVVKQDVNQGIDISIVRLSAPVEMLDLDRRASRILRRASMYTVAEVLLAGKVQLGTVKHIGAMTTTHIFEAMSGYLGLPVDVLTEEAVPGVAGIREVEDPIRVLPVPAKTLCALEGMGYSRIDQLVKVRANGYETLRGLRRQEIEAIDEELKHYLARMAQIRLVRLAGADAVLGPPDPEPTLISGQALSLLLPELSAEDWGVLSGRAMHPGLSPAETSAQNGGLHTKTVRRILRHAHRHVRLNLSELRVFLNYFEEMSAVFEKRRGQGPLDLQTLVTHLMPDPRTPDLILSPGDVERMIFLLRTLVQYPNPWFETEIEPTWPVLLRLSCLVEPVLAPQEHLPKMLPERAPAPRRKPYKKLAYTVLARTGEPMHWSAIAEQACEMAGRASFVTRSLQDSLTRDKDLFVHMGGGTYALAEWGCHGACPNPAREGDLAAVITV